MSVSSNRSGSRSITTKATHSSTSSANSSSRKKKGTREDAKVKVKYVPTNDELIALNSSISDFHSIRVHIDLDTIPNLRQQFTKVIYSKVETTAKSPLPLKVIEVAHDNVSIIVRNNDYIPVTKTFPFDNTDNSDKIKIFPTGHKRAVRRIAIWEGKKPCPQIITGSCDGIIKIFDYEGKLLRSTDVTTPEDNHEGLINCLCVSQDEAYEDALVASGGKDHMIKLWGLKTGKLKFNCEGHRSEIIAVAFCSGKFEGTGKVDLVASYDKLTEVRLWSKLEGTFLRMINFGGPVPEPSPKPLVLPTEVGSDSVLSVDGRGDGN